MGRADLSLKWNVAMLFVVPPVLWLGSQYGTMGLAWALLGFTVVMFVPGWFVLVRPLCHAQLSAYFTATLRPLLIATVSIAPAYFSTSQITNVYLHIIAAVLISGPLYIVLSYFLNRDWTEALIHLVAPAKFDLK
jgi:hypothetical protein